MGLKRRKVLENRAFLGFSAVEIQGSICRGFRSITYTETADVANRRK